MRLDSIHIILKEYIAEQEKLQCRWPCDAEYNVPTWDNIYDACRSYRIYLLITNLAMLNKKHTLMIIKTHLM